MDIRLAQVIAKNIGTRVRENYSGRGMCGEETAGVVGSPAQMVAGLLQNVEEVGEEIALLKSDGVRVPDSFRTDSMGYDTILY